MATGLDSVVKITVYLDFMLLLWALFKSALEKVPRARIIWLLEELVIISDKLFKRDKTCCCAELRNHLLGKSQSYRRELTVVEFCESATIVEYLVDHFGPHLIPQRYIDGKEGQVGGETESWRRDRYFMHYAEGIRDAPVPFFIRPVTKMIASQLHSALVKSDLATNLSFLEDQLKSSPGKGLFLCGDILTGSDILMSFPLEAGVLRGLINKEQHPYLTEYVSRIQEREAHKRGIAKIVELQGSYELIP
ncbi:glutathione S-transferase [Blastomyces gilchristii SLH14081]|uniref:Glutathione S-transferase n=1 Tax=Blastomyces gilchristii (strain SLH14081) TaxID=559298 RepID=A0A179UYR3_BLAGS|nr:glutathione S-transferase [Blastomyces gilchristii SLH14081]OAT12278.1 glutathione S-transferase [Blastomyces gilchristii SLH14081]